MTVQDFKDGRAIINQGNVILVGDGSMNQWCYIKRRVAEDRSRPVASRKPASLAETVLANQARAAKVKADREQASKDLAKRCKDKADGQRRY